MLTGRWIRAAGLISAGLLYGTVTVASAFADDHHSSGDSVPVSRGLDQASAFRFAGLAMDCIHKEFPNKISHEFSGPEDLGLPSDLYPVFYGCFDWHSAVHGHWLLVRTLRLHSQNTDAQAIEAALDQSFTAENIAGEVEYFVDRKSFERPYGLAWFLALMQELREWNTPKSQEWVQRFAPLETEIVNRFQTWLPDLAYPIRSGTHNQLAFGLALALDWAREAQHTELEALIIETANRFYLSDTKCPMAYEPSGGDFLSPCLMEADLMRRILHQKEFSDWLTNFLPEIPKDGRSDWLSVGIVNNPSDGKLVHLDGVNLSRAWNLRAIADALPGDDPRQPSLQACADIHTRAGVQAISSENYEGSHWLGSFATYLLTERYKSSK